MNDYKCATQHRLRLALIWVLVVLISRPAYGAPGVLDPTFGTGGKVTTDFSGSPADEVHAVLVQPDGKTMAVGTTGATGLSLDFGLVRYNYDGSLDPTFGTGGKVVTDFGFQEKALGAVLQPDGKIVVVGETRFDVLNSNFVVARYMPNGELDGGFAFGGRRILDFGGTATDSDSAYAVALQPDGKIVVAGTSDFGAPMRGVFAVARFDPNGALDLGFGAAGKAHVNFADNFFDVAFAVAIQPDGKIVLAGRGSFGAPYPGFALARLTSSGALDATFDVDGKVLFSILDNEMGAFSVALQADGKIVAAGSAVTSGGPTGQDWAILRCNPDGSIDPSFGWAGLVRNDFGAGEERIHEVLIDSAGKIVAAGRANSDFKVVRYLPSGATDLVFAPADFSPIDEGQAAAITPDGKIVVGGRADNGSPEYQNFALARWGTCAGSAEASLMIANEGNFGTVCYGSFKDLNLTITSNGTCPLVVTGLTVGGIESGNFQVPASGFPVILNPGSNLQVPIRFQPVSSAPGSRTAPITLNSSDETPPPYILVTGTVGAGDLKATPNPLDFGEICSNTVPERSLTLQNVGNCSLNVISATEACPDFAVTNGLPTNLVPGASTNLTVKFTPTSSGPKPCPLAITSTDPDSPATVNLYATSISGFPTVGTVPPFAPEVIQSVGACQTGQPFSIANHSACPVIINSVSITGAHAGDYALTGMPAPPLTQVALVPGAVYGTNLGILFKPTMVDRNRLATAEVSWVANPWETPPLVTRPLCGEGVRTGARVLVMNGALPVPLVERIHLQRKVGNVKKADLTSIDNARDLLLHQTDPSCGTILRFHREWGGLSNPVQLLPGSYQVTASAIVGGKRLSKSVGFDVTTCDFHPTIVIKLQ